MRSVTSRLSALRDDDVRTRLECEQRLRAAVDLAEQRHARVAHARPELARVAEGEHHRARPPRQDDVQDVGGELQRPGDEPVPNGGVTCLVELGGDPIPVDVAAAEKAEAARTAHRRRKPAPGGDRHRRRNDRMLQPEGARQARRDPHKPNVARCAPAR